MSVDQATVRRVAKLARIRVKDEELPVLANELNSILHWIEQLNAVDVSAVEPLTSVVSMKMKMRKDEVTDGSYPAKVVGGAMTAELSGYSQSTLPVLASNAWILRSAVPPLNTRPPAVAVGPALPLPPVSCFSGGSSRVSPSVLCQRMAPVFASSASSRDHGGR